MTNEQIINALKQCGRKHNEKNDKYCKECQFKSYLPCVAFLCDRTIDLINRQKAEIERLQYILLNFMNEAEEWERKYGVDIENIPQIAILSTVEKSVMKRIKSKAIQEFAERLKEKATSTFYEERKYVDTEDIDNLVKEMVGEE